MVLNWERGLELKDIFFAKEYSMNGNGKSSNKSQVGVGIRNNK